jgi:hypothetical protein
MGDNYMKACNIPNEERTVRQANGKEVTVPGWDGQNEETMPWRAFMDGVDPVGIYNSKTKAIDGGKFVYVFNPKHIQAPALVYTSFPPKTQAKVNQGYEVALMSQFRTRGGILTPSMSAAAVAHFMDKFQFWFDDPEKPTELPGILNIPSVEEQCLLTAQAFIAVPQLLQFAWADRPDFFTDDVKSMIAKRRSLAVPGMPEERAEAAEAAGVGVVTDDPALDPTQPVGDVPPIEGDGVVDTETAGAVDELPGVDPLTGEELVPTDADAAVDAATDAAGDAADGVTDVVPEVEPSEVSDATVAGEAPVSGDSASSDLPEIPADAYGDLPAVDDALGGVVEEAAAEVPAEAAQPAARPPRSTTATAAGRPAAAAAKTTAPQAGGGSMTPEAAAKAARMKQLQLAAQKAKAAAAARTSTQVNKPATVAKPAGKK